jgi:flagella basal body P-ring formation protein FlgA
MSSEAVALQIQLKKSVQVQGATVTVGQIAVISPESIHSGVLEELPVYRSLKAGEEVVIKAESIKALIDKKKPGLSEVDWSGPQETRVSREAMIVDQYAIEEILNDYIKSHEYQLPDSEIHFKKVESVEPVILPVGKLDVEVLPSDPSILRSRSFSLIFKVDDQLEKNISVRCIIEAIAPVAVAARDLRRGKIITVKDVRTSKVDIASLKRPYMTAEELVGKRIKRSVKQGKLFYPGMVETPPMIRRGEVVTMAARKGTLLVTAKGIALHDGRENEMIRVRNSSSRKEIIGRVKEPGLVTVVF